ncbi:MAG: hypothetical protein JW982_05990 [Spirochaetes bacterium]|nr:hypothetical protein [Spirochaetota bacterium]
MAVQLTGDTESSLLHNKIREYLSISRMCTAENLELKFNVQSCVLWPILETLKQNRFIRIVRKNFRKSCGEQSICEEAHEADSAAIIISLESMGNRDIT